MSGFFDSLASGLQLTIAMYKYRNKIGKLHRNTIIQDKFSRRNFLRSALLNQIQKYHNIPYTGDRALQHSGTRKYRKVFFLQLYQAFQTPVYFPGNNL